MPAAALASGPDYFPRSREISAFHKMTDNGNALCQWHFAAFGWLFNSAGRVQPARRRRPRGVGRKPAASSACASGEPWMPDPTVRPSARSTLSRPSAPSRTAAASAAALGRSSSGSSVQDSTVRPPRSTYSTRDPSTSTTSAPALRPGRCDEGVSPGRSGHGSAAPYGCAGSAAARTVPTRGDDPPEPPAPGGTRGTHPPRPPLGRSTIARIRSTAPGRANCAAPRPSTK